MLVTKFFHPLNPPPAGEMGLLIGISNKYIWSSKKIEKQILLETNKPN
jgi:hypothetical protein